MQVACLAHPPFSSFFWGWGKGLWGAWVGWASHEVNALYIVPCTTPCEV